MTLEWSITSARAEIGTRSESLERPCGSLVRITIDTLTSGRKVRAIRSKIDEILRRTASRSRADICPRHVRRVFGIKAAIATATCLATYSGAMTRTYSCVPMTRFDPSANSGIFYCTIFQRR
jgi:hypothetical protein